MAWNAQEIDSGIGDYIVIKESILIFRYESGGCMSEDRFTSLETIVSFHEDTIQKLNDIVYKQQLEIDKLEEKVDNLIQMLEASSEHSEPKNE